MSTDSAGKEAAPRRRMQRAERYDQLVQVAWRVIRDEGTDALSLGRLAEQAGVTKPVVYDHFRTRNGLLAALYREFDARQTEVIDAALADCDPELPATAAVIAASYVDCVLVQGQEIPDVVAALAGSPELGEVKREYQSVFIEKCRRILAPFSGAEVISHASLWAMLGAADALSGAAAAGEITPDQAKDELVQVIVAMVLRASVAPNAVQEATLRLGRKR